MTVSRTGFTVKATVIGDTVLHNVLNSAQYPVCRLFFILMSSEAIHELMGYSTGT